MNIGASIVAAGQFLVEYPALFLAFITMPIVFLARWKKIHPNTTMIWLVLLPVIPSLGLAFRPIAYLVFMVIVVMTIGAIVGRFFGMVENRTVVLLPLTLLVTVLTMTQEPIPTILMIDGFIIAVMVLDVLSLPRSKAFQVERSCQRTASLKKKHPVTLTISNLTAKSRFSLSNILLPKKLRDILQIGDTPITIKDDLPQEFAATPEDFSIDLPARSRTTLEYDLLASRRGAFSMQRVFIQGESRFGLWKRIIHVPQETTINVYPDMKQLAEFEMLARTNRLSLMGVRRTRRVGQDNDFERLRDYTLDDNYKHIDWRSTARRNKLTVRDFQTSQSQRIIFMIDCGRMMTSKAEGLSLLDHSLNAMLMLSYIALKRGDSVGLLCFSDRIHSYVPPRGGSRQMNHLLSASFDRFPELVESRYGEAFLHLSKTCRKRSLVILITNVIDEINANQVHQYMSTMVGRHLPMGVLLRDHELFRSADVNWKDDAGLYRTAAAAEIICWRQEVIRDLQHEGVLSLDVFPEDMTAPLINRYLEVKARHLL